MNWPSWQGFCRHDGSRRTSMGSRTCNSGRLSRKAGPLDQLRKMQTETIPIASISLALGSRIELQILRPDLGYLGGTKVILSRGHDILSAQVLPGNATQKHMRYAPNHNGIKM